VACIKEIIHLGRILCDLWD